MSTTSIIAQTIIDQLGKTAIAMLGTKLIGTAERYIVLTISGSKKASKIKIELMADDTYTVSFFKIRKFEIASLVVKEGIYEDMLRKVIEQNTGLYTSI